MGSITFRLAEDDADAILVFRTYIEMHDEGCVPGPIDKVKTLTNCIAMVQGPKSAVLMAMDGDEIAGVLALVEDGYWWNTERCLADKGLYVRKNFRGTDAIDILLSEAIALSDQTGLPLYITINNLMRRRGGKSPWERLGITLGYHPQGAVLAHYPGE